MIVLYANDSHVRRATRRAAGENEDVFERSMAHDALELGTARLLIRSEEARIPARCRVPVLTIDREMLRRWEMERRSVDHFESRLTFMSRRIRSSIEMYALRATWVDTTLADLSRAAGAPLPPAFRGFARRVLEHPAYYRNLHPLAARCGSSRGALKARFRRKGLPSPSLYQRWLRLLAVANALSDRWVTVAAAARRTGFTSDGNMCRAFASLSGLTPTEARSVQGWNRLVIKMAWELLTPEALAQWDRLDDIFVRRRA